MRFIELYLHTAATETHCTNAIGSYQHLSMMPD